MSSIVFDFVTRQKVILSLNQFILEQFPIISFEKWRNWEKLIIPKALELIYTSKELEDFARDCGYEKKPFKWDQNRRNILQTELDAIYAHLYKISKEELNHILETFPVLKRKEIKEFGEFKTKRLVLGAYDKYAQQPELFK